MESWSPSPVLVQCSPTSVTSVLTAKPPPQLASAFPHHTDEFEPETRGETGLLPEGLDGPAICRVYPVAWFQLFRAVPHVSAGVGWGSHPAHVICCSQLLQHPLCVSLLASAVNALGGLATTSPLCQTHGVAGV